MKTRPETIPRRFQLKLAFGNFYYIDRIAKLEAALARKPRTLQIDLIGAGEIPADATLLIRSVLLDRSPKTRLITAARSSLHGGSVLVWLLGDQRIIRDDARLFFRRANLSEDAEAKLDEAWDGEPKYRDSYSEIDPEEGDYLRVLEGINEFLPVKELAGRLIGVPVLRQFSLIENEKADNFLATVFSKSPKPADHSLNAANEKRVQRREKARARQVRK